MDPPPFPVEDQTDEDFFDKLVEDEGRCAVRSGHNLAERLDLDAQSPVNPRIEVGSSQFALDSASILQGASGEEYARENLALYTADGCGNNVVAGLVGAAELSKEIGNRDTSGESDNHVKGALGSKDFCNGINRGRGGGVKEVQWSAFNSDLNGSIQEGSDSDFFSNIEGNSAEPLGEVVENHVVGSENVSGVSSAMTEGMSLSNYAQNVESRNHDEHSQSNAVVQYINSVQYWESLYPGWKYDHSTGQWCQVHDHENGNSNSKSRSEVHVSDRQHNIFYLQQTAQSAVASIVGENNGGDVAFRNQTSSGTHGYSLNMVFDPQYPSWYYDTIAQEWRSLESYNGSLNQVESRDHGQVLQNGIITSNYQNTHVDYGQEDQADSYSQQQDQAVNWGASVHDYHHLQNTNMLLHQSVAKSQPVTFSHDKLLMDGFVPSGYVDNSIGRRTDHMASGHTDSHDQNGKSFSGNSKVDGFQSFVPAQFLIQNMNQQNKLNNQTQFLPAASNCSNLMNFSQQMVERSAQFLSASSEGRSPDGRPAHTLVTFGFGGKLIVMKDCSSLSYGSQDSAGGVVNVFNLMDIVMPTYQGSDVGLAAHDYFHSLCHQSFPGPLVSSNVGGKEVNKWIDEKVTTSVNPQVDYGKTEISWMLFSLLKIACHYYGKLRSPFGTDKTMKESDCPELALAKMFASAKGNGEQFTQYGAVTHCLQNLLSEDQIQARAVEVEKLLVTGRRIEALQYAQEGQLWGLAIVIASLLGDQFYGDTVKQMAIHQMSAGSPLRTLCLLIAGQPAEAFSNSSTNYNQPNTLNVGSNYMLGKWEENLAVITANRTKGDELVITHLGDCLWKEKGEVTAAHICYLVAGVRIESYSDSARLCLIGADHWKYPRTYATPEAIQRTELFEYAKVLGNSQFILLPLQPYKLIYAHMLAEVGKLSDALKYCQAVLKCLKTGRAIEVDTWRNVASSLEDRIKIHQQGGYAPNLAPSKLVGKLLNFFDSTAHRVVGLPPTAPSMFQTNGQHNENDHQSRGSKVSSSQSTMVMSSLMSSASVEPLNEWIGGDCRKSLHNRSISEPNFGRTPGKVHSPERSNPSGSQDNASNTGGASHFGRIGLQLFQKTFGLVLKVCPGHQAKLGEKNKFYYDEKLKRWVEEGVDPPAEETVLPPPPTGDFMNKMPGQNMTSHNKWEGPMSVNGVQDDKRLDANGKLEFSSPDYAERLSGIPPVPPSSNHFSARGRMGVRARYVDTFNKSSEVPTNLFQSPSLPATNFSGISKANFFIPTPVPSGPEEGTEAIEAWKGAPTSDTNPTTFEENSPFSSLPQPKMPTSVSPIHRHPSKEELCQMQTALL